MNFCGTFLTKFFLQVDFGDATLTIASVGFGLLFIFLVATGVWTVHKMHKRKVLVIIKIYSTIEAKFNNLN